LAPRPNRVQSEKRNFLSGSIVPQPRPRFPEYLQAGAVDIPLDLVVPEPHDLESSQLEMPIAFEVSHGLIVLTAFDLDDQPRLEAHEIEDVIVERHLALELQTLQLLVSQCLPQDVFRFGGVWDSMKSELCVATRMLPVAGRLPGVMIAPSATPR
jgi:hypothetical protein